MTAFPPGVVTPLVRVLTLQDHNTRVVLLGTLLLGIAAGVVGTFTLLRRRALLGDALAHATLPGVAVGFLVGIAWYDTRSLPLLLAGATVTGVLGLGVVLLLRAQTRLKEDAAMGIVLSVFFGGGVCLLTVVQQTGSGAAAGLEGFIYGKTASLLPRDAWTIAAAGGACVVAAAVLFKELRLLCFDADFAAAQGWPTLWLDVALMAMTTAVTVVGLQAVGLILVIALLIIPAAAARFWSDRLGTMTLVSAAIGGSACAAGAAVSAVVPRLPGGAIIVLVATAAFGMSMAFGTARGVVPRALGHVHSRRLVARQHLLRAVWELSHSDADASVAVSQVVARRSWDATGVRRTIARSARAGLIETTGDAVRLTPAGAAEASRVSRNHRLWRAYLIAHADVAPSHVHTGADAIEHVLDADMVAELEALVGREAARA